MTDDELVRAAFSEAKADEMRAHPSFESIRARPASRRTRLDASPVLRLAAAGLLIAAGLATYRTLKARDDARFIVPSDVAALSTWRPATDVLLAMPTDLFRAAPVLGTSILDPISDHDTTSTGAFR